MADYVATAETEIDAPREKVWAALEERLLSIATAGELEQLRRNGEAELEEPGRRGTTFMLLQSWGQRAA